VKKDGRFSHIPVILLVGAFDPLDEKEARRVGADGILKKPFVPPDPLIAMVTAVLEKNPKLAAELVVARNTAAQAAQAPPTVAAVEVPSAVAPKPLPEFPEPSPEESALIYGFGSGRRALDSAKDSISSSEPPAPVAEEGDESTDEFDGAATSRDWRRNAMDFEIPEDAAKRPAFASDENLDAIDFPSSDLESPEQAPVSELQEGTAHAASETDEFDGVSGFSQFDQKEEAIDLAREAKPQPATSELEVRAARPEIHSETSEHILETPVLSSESGSETRQAAEPKIPQQVQEVPAADHDATPEPSFASKVRGWMDAISPSGYAEGGWFASLTAAVTGSEKSKSHVDLSHSPASEMAIAQDVSNPSVAGFPNVESAPDNIPEDGRISHEPEASDAESEIAAAVPPSSTIRFFEDDFSEDSFFADEPAVDAHFSEESSERQPEETPAAQALESNLESESHASAEPVPDSVEDDVPISVAGFASGRGASSRAAESLGSYKEPDLIEPPAVRVVPDPLLEDSGPDLPSLDYGSHPVEVPAVHDFVPPAPEIPLPAQPAAEEFVAAELLPAEDIRAEEAAEVSRATPPTESVPSEGIEVSSAPVSAAFDSSAWTATARPASRADLASIPFLAPPREFFTSQAQATKQSSPEVVDAIVQKVLERIEPRLRQMLAQGLKPLVENVLEDEAEKKRS
jgi:hypothetical protein